LGALLELSLTSIQDWIRSREGDDESGATTMDSSHRSGAALAAANDPEKQYIPVPDDPALTNSACPVCKEKFEIKWLDKAQEFVWMDARKIEDRIFHASCYADLNKNANIQVSRGTPEPVLGKRKAEVIIR
jgi:pre-mRNA cleavage complex 2 protein Pcf11